MDTLNTVRGEIEPGDLGNTLVHELVVLVNDEFRRNFPRYPEAVSDAEIEDIAVRKLKEVKERGIDTVLDATVIGLGRNVERLQRINELVDINLLVATGFYSYADVPTPFLFIGPGTFIEDVDPMITLMVGDISEGIADTGVKAAFLKCAIDAHGLTGGVKRILTATAEAHRETGAFVTVHSNPENRSGIAAQEFLVNAGVEANRIVVAHSNDTTDIDYLRELLDTGSYLGMDSFGIDFILPFAERIDTLLTLIEMGYEEQLVLSQDSPTYTDWLPRDVLRRLAPNWHMTHIVEDVLPEIMSRGVSDDTIAVMLRENPRRLLLGS